MEYTSDIKNRLKRTEGQLRGILRMMEEENDCKEILTQLSAARRAIDRTMGLVVAKNLEACIKKQMEIGQSSEDVINEAVELIVKSR